MWGLNHSPMNAWTSNPCAITHSGSSCTTAGPGKRTGVIDRDQNYLLVIDDEWPVCRFTLQAPPRAGISAEMTPRPQGVPRQTLPAPAPCCFVVFVTPVLWPPKRTLFRGVTSRTARESVLFGGHSAGLTNITKQQELEPAASAAGRPVAEVSSLQRSRLWEEPEAADQPLIVNNEQIIGQSLPFVCQVIQSYKKSHCA